MEGIEVIKTDAELISASDVFDADFYRAHFDSSLEIADPAMHFCLHWKEYLLSPSRKFDLKKYLAAYPDIAISGRNPLVDYLRSPNGARRRWPTDVDWDEDRIIGHLTIRETRKSIYGANPSRIVILASYDPRRRIQNALIAQVESLREVADCLIFVADNYYPFAEIAKIRHLLDAYDCGRHGEYDFGSWKRGLQIARSIGTGSTREILLCNDSVFGPLRDLKQIFTRMEKASCDFWGISNSFEVREHLQSYFMAFRPQVFNSSIFQDFFRSVKEEAIYSNVVENYELRLTERLMNAGFSYEAVCDFRRTWPDKFRKGETCDQTLWPVRNLGNGSPFIRRRSLFNPETHNKEGVQDTLKALMDMSPAFGNIVSSTMQLETEEMKKGQKPDKGRKPSVCFILRACNLRPHILTSFIKCIPGDFERHVIFIGNNEIATADDENIFFAKNTDECASFLEGLSPDFILVTDASLCSMDPAIVNRYCEVLKASPALNGINLKKPEIEAWRGSLTRKNLEGILGEEKNSAIIWRLDRNAWLNESDSPSQAGTPPQPHTQDSPSASVSIIIPLYNNLSYTRETFRSIEKYTGERFNWEVIAVDNNSQDGTKFEAPNTNRMRIIRNDSNLGFSRASNQGALLSDAEYLVFLNNDTSVYPGWLDPLIDELIENEETGISGSRLVYPDGSIQHAGVVVNRTKDPAHIYYGTVGDNPVILQRREFPMLTGACMAVRREEFVKLGMFSDDYVNGYEDCDLCMRYHEAGYTCVYRPDSIVCHFESKSEGRHALENKNQELFRKTYADRLEQDDFRHLDVQVFEQRHPTMLAINIGAHDRSDLTSPEIDLTENLARALSLSGYRVNIHYQNEWKSGTQSEDVIIWLSFSSVFVPLAGKKNLLWILRNPELYSRESLEKFDSVWAASSHYSQQLRHVLKVPTGFLAPQNFIPEKYPTRDSLVYIGDATAVKPDGLPKMIDWLLDEDIWAATRLDVLLRDADWQEIINREPVNGRRPGPGERQHILDHARIAIFEHDQKAADLGLPHPYLNMALASGVNIITNPVKGLRDGSQIRQVSSKDAFKGAIMEYLKREDAEDMRRSFAETQIRMERNNLDRFLRWLEEELCIRGEQAFTRNRDRKEQRQ